MTVDMVELMLRRWASSARSMVSREAGEGVVGALLGFGSSLGALGGALFGGWGSFEGEAKRSSALEGEEGGFCSMFATRRGRVEHWCFGLENAVTECLSS